VVVFLVLLLVPNAQSKAVLLLLIVSLHSATFTMLNHPEFSIFFCVVVTGDSPLILVRVLDYPAEIGLVFVFQPLQCFINVMFSSLESAMRAAKVDVSTSSVVVAATIGDLVRASPFTKVLLAGSDDFVLVLTSRSNCKEGGDSEKNGGSAHVAALFAVASADKNNEDEIVAAGKKFFGAWRRSNNKNIPDGCSNNDTGRRHMYLCGPHDGFKGTEHDVDEALKRLEKESKADFNGVVKNSYKDEWTVTGHDNTKDHAKFWMIEHGDGCRMKGDDKESRDCLALRIWNKSRD